jgi:hypothetical protein
MQVFIKYFQGIEIKETLPSSFYKASITIIPKIQPNCSKKELTDQYL